MCPALDGGVLIGGDRSGHVHRAGLWVYVGWGKEGTEGHRGSELSRPTPAEPPAAGSGRRASKDGGQEGP